MEDQLAIAQRNMFTDRMKKTVVLIYDEGQAFVMGHGVLISSDGLILTAYHVLESNVLHSEVIIKCYNGQSMRKYVAEIVKEEGKYDLCLLQVKRKVAENSRKKNKQKAEDWNFQFAVIGDDVTIGQTVQMVSSNDGENFEYTTGTVAFQRREKKFVNRTENINYIGEDTVFVQAHNLHGVSGCSGAPVFNSLELIVGIYSFGYMRMDFLVHPSEVKKFVTST